MRAPIAKILKWLRIRRGRAMGGVHHKEYWTHHPLDIRVNNPITTKHHT